jgi:hypothetical protein
VFFCASSGFRVTKASIFVLTKLLNHEETQEQSFIAAKKGSYFSATH